MPPTLLVVARTEVDEKCLIFVKGYCEYWGHTLEWFFHFTFKRKAGCTKLNKETRYVVLLLQFIWIIINFNSRRRGRGKM